MFEKEISQYLDELVTRDDFSGVVLVAKDGTPILEKGYGLAHKGYQIPNQVHTKYNIGSATKMFTAVAITQLAEQGKLNFHDTLGKYGSWFPPEISKKVTLHHLLTHTSGMVGSILNEQTFQANKDLVRTTEDWLAFITNVPLLFEPGTAWSYSNAGFLALGAVIEALTGKTYFDYVSEHIWHPAEMHDSDSTPLDEDVPNRALGYMSREDNEATDRPRKNNIPYSLIRGNAHGGAWSTVGDLLRFAMGLQNNSLLDSKHKEILLSEKVLTGRRVGEGYAYAYGFFSETLNGHLLLGHGGMVAGFNSSFRMYRDLGYTAIVLSNYSPPVAQQVGEKIRSIITQEF
jgi:D-alanyl-D-alanine carboxypeptidase